MTARLRLLTLTLLFAALSAPAFAQDEKAPERRLDLEEVRELRKQTAENASFSDELRAGILELYDAAISSFESAAAFESEARNHLREKAGVSRMVDALRAELEQPDRQPRLRLPEDATVDRAEAELERERSHLAANRAALRDLERLAEERAGSRNEISRRLGALDQGIESINDELRSTSERDAHPELKNAARSALLARREAATREIEVSRAKLDLLNARGALLPWRIDQAQRRVAYSEKLVAMLEDATQELRRNDAQAWLRRVVEQCDEAAAETEVLNEVADETRRIAELLWASDGLEARLEEAARDVELMRKNLSDLDRIIQLTRRKYQAFGHRGSIQRWWPEIPDDFPKPGEVANRIVELEQTIPEVQHKLIRFEQQRSKSRSLRTQILEDLEAEEKTDDEPRLRHLAQGLFDTRRELLDYLIQLSGRYSNLLAELESVSRRYQSEEERVRDFLYERLLWVRSVPRPIVPRPGDVGSALLWLVNGSNLKEVAVAIGHDLKRFPGRGAGFVVAFGLLLWLRRPMRRRLETLAGAVASPETDSFRATLEALLYTVLLAAPLPLALRLVSEVLPHSDASPFLFSAGGALWYVASIAALFELARQGLSPHGLAKAHFHWPTRIIRPIHRGLLWREIVFLPLIYIAVQMGEAGMRLDSPRELLVYNNSLGRVAFILATAILGFSLLTLFRPRKRVEGSDRDPEVAWLRRLYVYAYPVIVLGALVPALLAAIGFYITGYLLAYQMLRTAWLLTILLIVSGLLWRWRDVGLRKASETSADEAAPDHLPAAESQVRKLFRFAIVLAGAVGLYAIWSEADPTLQMMKRVQIWPRVVLLEPAETDALASLPRAEGKPVDADAAPEGETPSTPAASGAPVPVAPTAGDGGGSEGAAPLTLWHLLEAVLAGIVTAVLVRNIPGLLELILRRRTHLDRGARIALSTLVRYTILILGVSVAFGVLGVSWSKIQWLAAALTFGLGFGLQEIVANFVSGLILLMERPVRVGDAVTVGNLQGRVSRIQIRATTISLWDQSEMIVPNKEFITTKLINWTLSDSRRRIDIPLRVAYGADLEKVKETLLQVAADHPDVFDDPPPQALLLDFGDDAVKFELRYFVDFGMGLRTRDELHMRIDHAFRENGIDFALPKLDIRIPRRSEGRNPRGAG
jgi:potassium efflux system protein